jgi:hypothetical protein
MHFCLGDLSTYLGWLVQGGVHAGNEKIVLEKLLAKLHYYLEETPASIEDGIFPHPPEYFSNSPPRLP